MSLKKRPPLASSMQFSCEEIERTCAWHFSSPRLLDRSQWCWREGKDLVQAYLLAPSCHQRRRRAWKGSSSYSMFRPVPGPAIAAMPPLHTLGLCLCKLRVFTCSYPRMNERSQRGNERKSGNIRRRTKYEMKTKMPK